MNALLAFARAVDGLNARIGRASMWLILLTVLISAGNALSRKLLSVSSNALLEIQWTLYAAVFLLAAAYTLQKNEHVRIDVLVGRLSPRAGAVVDIIGGLLFVLPFTSLVLVYAWPFFLESWRSGEVSNNPGGLMLWPGKALIPLGFSLLWLQGLAEVIKRIAFLAGRAPEPVLSHSPQGEDMILREDGQ
ncbi:TRAP transporter small permease subunit [Thiobacter aerophilum]|uniref:TRAP transporter small permease protein n=1 Tax=Thiobacter aerophilum TaxID=3121275 RepID=A0ABV0EEW1_9BURK